MRKNIILLYGLACYGVFFSSLIYSIGFIANLWVPKSIDSVRMVSLTSALATDIALLGLFAVQHSVMARPLFKRWWVGIVPAAAERSTYVLFSSLALIALFSFWQPIGGVVWEINLSAAKMALYGAYTFGWGLLLLSTFLIDHFDLFGLRQVWLQFRSVPYTRVQFKTPWLYQHVRHPLYVGWLFIFWSTPTMTVTHLLFALMTTAYILIAIRFEEHDLVTEHPEYEEYRQRVPMLLPFGKRQRESFKAPAVGR